MEGILFRIAVFIYFAGMVGYFISLVVRRVQAAKISTWVLFAGFAFHTLSLAVRWLQPGYGTIINLFEAFSFIAWSVTGVYLLFQLRTKTRVLGALVSPAVVILSIAASVRMAPEADVPTALKGPWVASHAILTLSGGGFFALACLAGIMYLVQDRLIMQRKSYGFTRFLPSLKELDRVNHISVITGFILLTFGIIAGAVWAHTAWGQHWQWDPKQVGTLVSWLLYGLLLHQRLALGWKGKKTAYFSIIAFVILLFTIVGINLFFVTVHNFS